MECIFVRGRGGSLSTILTTDQKHCDIWCTQSFYILVVVWLFQQEAHESLAQADQLATDASMKAEIEYRHKLEELQRERQKQQVNML